MKEHIINGRYVLQPESNNDIFLIGLKLYKFGCHVCDSDGKKIGRCVGYCDKHSTSGRAYLTYFPDDHIKKNNCEKIKKMRKQ